MFSSFFKIFYYIIAIICIIVILISTLFIPTISDFEIIEKMKNIEIIISSEGFAWPIPGYTTITSYFGKRVAPTRGSINIS
ncbi:MAG: hypothetical protein GX682_02200 [Clostridiaceae bacterium]|nr:hypothetical protein [Clostridiaceae bacterium]